MWRTLKACWRELQFALPLARRVLTRFRLRRVDLLQAPHPDGIASPRSNCLDGRARTAHRRDARDPVRHRIASNGFFIPECMRVAGARVNTQADRTGFR